MPNWKRRITGNITGRIQVATFASVFAGFVLATSTSLWIQNSGMRRLHIAHESQLVGLLTKCLDEQVSGPKSDNSDSKVLCLDRYSGHHLWAWLVDSSGKHIYPSSPEFGSLKSIKLPQGLEVGEPVSTMHDGHALLVTKNEYIGGELYAVGDISSSAASTSDSLALSLIILTGVLIVTTLSVSALFKRILEPNNSLNSQASLVIGKNIYKVRIHVGDAPQEVEQVVEVINDLLDRLADEAESQRQFTNAVSHELRTPLTLLGGYLRRSLKSPDLIPEKPRRSLQQANDELVRINQIIGDLLDLARADQHRLNIELEKVDAVKLIAHAKSELDTLIPNPIIIDTTCDEACVLASPGRLSQVITNLVENASKYSDSDSPIVISISQSDQQIVLEICDKGIGIPQQDLDSVFDRFRRGSNVGEISGSGLGLPVVKALVEAMSAKISVSSMVGFGTSFTILFSKCSLA